MVYWLCIVISCAIIMLIELAENATELAKTCVCVCVCMNMYVCVVVVVVVI